MKLEPAQSDTYKYYQDQLKANSRSQKVWVIMSYLMPGVIFTIFCNVKVIHDFLSSIMSLSSVDYQFVLLILLSFGWHIGYPLYVLRIRQKYTWKDTSQALSLDKFSIKGFFGLTPAFFFLALVVGVPYMRFVFPVMNEIFQSVPFMAIPEHSLFFDYTSIYGLAQWQLILLFVGNFIGEEIYFRGYLFKKSSFLGKHNWWIHSVLFSLYHFWQMPMTYSLTFISLSFGIWMIWRKNLYELILLHILINLFLPAVVQAIF